MVFFVVKGLHRPDHIEVHRKLIQNAFEYRRGYELMNQLGISQHVKHQTCETSIDDSLFGV